MSANNYDFSTYTGKLIDAESYYYTLTEMGWKYDTEESNLFIALTKTFWKENMKVCLALQDWCCVPPYKESTSIESIDFYAFNPLVFKQKSIYTEYEDLYHRNEYHDFETVEDYINWMNNNNPSYIAHADFNTGDFALMTRVDVKDVSIDIQKTVCEDLQSI